MEGQRGCPRAPDSWESVNRGRSNGDIVTRPGGGDGWNVVGEAAEVVKGTSSVREVAIDHGRGERITTTFLDYGHQDAHVYRIFHAN